MGKYPYDVAVIGSGPGGYIAAIRAAQLGFKTICIEKEVTLGGTCLNIGCIPSKALLQSTEYYAWLAHEAKEHGIEAATIGFDLNQMMLRKSKVVKSLVDGVAGLFKGNKIDRSEGVARLVSPNKIEVDNGKDKSYVEAEYILLATGSEPISLPFLPFDEKFVLSSTGALSLKQVPKKMLVVGAGVIGVELASVYSRLGAQVTIVEMLDTICPAMDHTMSKTLLQVLKKQGLVFHLGVQVTKAQVDKGVVLTVKQKDQELTLDSDVVLVAVGRRPYSRGLGLAELGIPTTNRGFVPVDQNFRTTIPNIFAIGDLIEGPMLAHRASEEGVAAVEIMAGMNPQVNYMAIPNVIYTHPEVAALGLTEKEALDLGMKLKIGTSFFKGNARARCTGPSATEGLVKVIGDASSGRLIGMHIIGPHASEMIGEGVVAIEMKATVADIANAPHAHPSLSESIKEAALAALH